MQENLDFIKLGSFLFRLLYRELVLNFLVWTSLHEYYYWYEMNTITSLNAR